MPTYLYLCEVSDPPIEFEEYHSITKKLDECPICKEKSLPAHEPKRLISGGSGRGIVELSGDELVAKVKDDVRKMKRDIHTDERQYANIIGESRYQSLQTKIDKQKR